MKKYLVAFASFLGVVGVLYACDNAVSLRVRSRLVLDVPVRLQLAQAASAVVQAPVVQERKVEQVPLPQPRRVEQVEQREQQRVINLQQQQFTITVPAPRILITEQHAVGERGQEQVVERVIERAAVERVVSDRSAFSFDEFSIPVRLSASIRVRPSFEFDLSPSRSRSRLSLFGALRSRRESASFDFSPRFRLQASFNGCSNCFH